MRPTLFAAVGAIFAGGIIYGPGQPPAPSTLDGPLTVNGPVAMTSGPMEIDGGSSARSYTGGTMLSHVSSADAGTFGTLTAGTSTLGPTVGLTGPVTITGATVFNTPPTGIVRKGVLTRASSLALSIGCASLGTVAVTGATAESACAVTYRPSAVSFGAVLDCYVTAPGTVTVRSCALVALLSAPAGDYGVTLVGE